MFKFYACALFMLLGVHLQAVVVVNELDGDITLHGFMVYSTYEGKDCYTGVSYLKVSGEYSEPCSWAGEYWVNPGKSMEILDPEMFYITTPGCSSGRKIYPVDSNTLIRVVYDGDKIKVIHENRTCECGKK